MKTTEPSLAIMATLDNAALAVCKDYDGLMPIALVAACAEEIIYRLPSEPEMRQKLVTRAAMIQCRTITSTAGKILREMGEAVSKQSPNRRRK